ncbi:MAG: class I SAM-dependent methyltransferase [Candidatus Methanomethylicia archaeon]
MWQGGKYKLIPYGIDFIEESIKQAKEVILPEYAQNFIVGNIVDVDLGIISFDFIFFDPYDVHPDDLQTMVSRLLKAIRPEGKIIFYTYIDVLKVLKFGWVGDLLPLDIAKKLKRIDHKEVSIGVYTS